MANNRAVDSQPSLYFFFHLQREALLKDGLASAGLLWVAIIATWLMVGCAASSTNDTASTADVPIAKTDAEWQECSKRVYNELVERGRRETADPSAYVGMGGSGGSQAVTDACGRRPEPVNFTVDQMRIIREHCKYSPTLDISLSSLSNADFSHFNGYGENTALRSKVSAECERFYASTAIDRQLEQADNQRKKKAQQQASREKVLNEQGFTVARFFESSGISNTVILETTARRRLKCAAYDGSGIPLAVQHAIITPPVDEVVLVMRNPSLAQRVRCWSL